MLKNNIRSPSWNLKSNILQESSMMCMYMHDIYTQIFIQTYTDRLSSRSIHLVCCCTGHGPLLQLMVPCTLSLGKTWERQATFIFWFGNRSTMTHLCTFQPSRNDGYIFERYKIVLERECSKNGLPKRCASCWILDWMIETKRKTFSFESFESKKTPQINRLGPRASRACRLRACPAPSPSEIFHSLIRNMKPWPSWPWPSWPRSWKACQVIQVIHLWIAPGLFEKLRKWKGFVGFVLRKLRTCFVENSLLLYSWRCWRLRWRMWRITIRSELVERIVECIIPKTSAWTPLAFLVFSWYILLQGILEKGTWGVAPECAICHTGFCFQELCCNATKTLILKEEGILQEHVKNLESDVTSEVTLMSLLTEVTQSLTWSRWKDIQTHLTSLHVWPVCKSLIHFMDHRGSANHLSHVSQTETNGDQSVSVRVFLISCRMIHKELCWNDAECR